MAFPTTSVLDDFTRADNASSLGASWTTGPETGYGSLGISSNRAYAASAYKENYWNVTQFGANQEVFATVPVLPVYRVRLLARIQGSGASTKAYTADLGSTATTRLGKIVSGAYTEIGSDSTVFSAGDRIGLEVDGTTVRLHRYTGGAWSTLEEVTGQTDVAGAGYIGIEIGDETTARIDDFGGGAIVVAETQSFYTYRRRTVGARR